MAIPPGKLPSNFPGNPNQQQNNNTPQMPRSVMSNPNLAQIAKLAQQQQQANSPQQLPLSPPFPQGIAPSAAAKLASNLQNSNLVNPNLLQALPQLLKYSNQNLFQQVGLQNQSSQNAIQGLINPIVQQAQQNGSLRLPHVQTPGSQAHVQFQQFQPYQQIPMPNSGPQSPSSPQLAAVSSAPIHPSMPIGPAKKVKETVPKAEVNLSSLPMSEILKNCKVTSRFVPQIDNFQKEHNVVYSEKAISTIAFAFTIRMREVVQECVRICHNRVAQSCIEEQHTEYMADREKLLQRQKEEKERGNDNQFLFQTQQKNLQNKYLQKVLYYLPSEPYYTEIPKIKLAQLEAERQIIQSGAPILPPKPDSPQQQANSKDQTNDALRNAVICGIASRKPKSDRDKITECIQDGQENILPDINSLSHLGFIKQQPLEITFNDVYQFVENDFFFTPKKLVTPDFSLQLRLIDNLQNEIMRNHQKEQEDNS